ncbi:SDR family oxidoreductase [Streptomyces orinoci]|uniref:SDR family oxidoreductase n=1 Tax=Streptomyces orinoci TaxID=67339 RepID=A0ABV3K0P8_STRON|nr:SDR family oxidoreductase [Streptomyces orinoci]
MPVAVTGATGFVGLRLVRELLRYHPSLLLLTRAGGQAAVPRVARFLESAGAPGHVVRQVSGRLTEVAVDLRRRDLGLSPEGYRRLADEIELLWHCAADTSFTRPPEEARATNADGTRHLLGLLAQGERRPPLCHLSTVAVAGAQRSGVVPERELAGVHGFHTAYERTKFEAETAVRAWSRAHDRPVVIFRLCGVVSDGPVYPGAPPHPLLTAVRAVRSHRAAYGLATAADGRIVLYRDGPRTGTVNLLPVEHAVPAMAEAARRTEWGGTRTYHIVNPRNVPCTVVLRALGAHCGVSFRVLPASRDGDGELYRLQEAFRGLLSVDRRYENAGIARLGISYPPEPHIDHPYLLRTLRGSD